MPGWLARCAITLILLAATGCYRPAFEDCALTCGPGGLCPDELHCVDGLCRTEANPGACPVVADGGAVPDANTLAPDARTVDANPGDPDASTCTCDPLSQSCCEPAEACDLAVAGTPYCRAVSNALTQGQQCNVAAQCARGLSCVAPDGTFTVGASTCHAFCDTNDDCAGEGGLCDVPFTGSGVKACTTRCDPLDHTGCQALFACTPALAADGQHWHTDCRRTGTFAQGHTCASTDECRRNLLCAGTPATCVKVCSMSAPGGSGCPGATTCKRLGTTGAIFGGVEYGACL